MLRVNNLAGGATILGGPKFENWAAKSGAYTPDTTSSDTFEFNQSAAPGAGEVLFDGNASGDRAWLIFVLAEASSGTSTLSSITLEGVDISGSQIESNVENDIFCASYLVRPPALAGGDADIAVNFGSFDYQDGISVHILEFSNVNSITKIDSANFDNQDTQVNQTDLPLTAARGAMIVLFCLIDLNSTPSATPSGFFASGVEFGPNNSISATMARFMYCKKARASSLGTWSVSGGLSSTDFIGHIVAFK